MKNDSTDKFSLGKKRLIFAKDQCKKSIKF